MTEVHDRVPSTLVRGSGKVELFDERGKLVEQVPFENFIAQPMRDRTRWMVRQDYAPSAALIGTNYTDPTPVYPLTHINLSNDATAENSATERRLLGNVIAWANKTAYSGADTLRGTPNLAESSAGPTTIKYVFDWPTTAGNGTFQSIAWVSGTDAHGIQSVTWDYSSAGFNSYPSASGAYDPVADAFLYRDGGSTYRVNRLTRAQTTIQSLTNSNNRLIAMRDGLLWLYRVDTNDFYSNVLGTTATSETKTGYKANVPNGLADATINAAGTEFWAVNSASGAVVHRLNFADGTYLGTIATPFVPYRIGILGDDILISSSQVSNQTKWARVTSAGVVKWVLQTSSHVYSGESLVHMAGVEINGEEWVGGGISTSTQGFHVARLDNKNLLGTRTLLATPVTKLNTQTLKVTYQFNFA